MKLYGYIASPYVARAVLAARWKGCGLELTPPVGGSIKSAEYLLVNPLGKMPALEDEGRCLAESTVICEYIDETQPGRKLLPEGAMDRAQSRLIARVLDTYAVPHMSALFRNSNPARRSGEEVQAAVTGLRKSLADLERFMGPGPWALGVEPGFADAVMAPTFFVVLALLQIFGVNDLFDGLPRLGRWWRAVEADPMASVLHREFDTAFAAFMQSRMKAA